jgi:hypothetical protein
MPSRPMIKSLIGTLKMPGYVYAKEADTAQPVEPELIFSSDALDFENQKLFIAPKLCLINYIRRDINSVLHSVPLVSGGKDNNRTPIHVIML